MRQGSPRAEGDAGWRAWLPARLQVDAAERIRAACGAALGILVAALLSRVAAGSLPASLALPWMVAPLGASAVLVFAVPASPLAQPWAVVGGNTVAALVGIACALTVPDPAWAAALAVGLAIGAMFTLRCLHPPGGAMALLTAIGGVSHVGFALFPAAINSLLLVAAGVAYNRATGRRYPHAQQAAAAPSPAGAPGFSDADLDTVLERYNQVLDLPRDDLAALLAAAEGEAYRRRLGVLRCGDVMSPEPVTVSFGTPLHEAWALLRERRIKALPVVDRAKRVVGIVTLADFLRHADLDLHDGWSQRLRAFIRPSGATHGAKAEVVGQIMTRQVRVASAERPLAELLPLFAQGGHHHIPIVGAEARLVGMLTQSDVVSSLLRSG